MGLRHANGARGEDGEGDGLVRPYQGFLGMTGLGPLVIDSMPQSGLEIRKLAE